MLLQSAHKICSCTATDVHSYLEFQNSTLSLLKYEAVCFMPRNASRQVTFICANTQGCPKMHSGQVMCINPLTVGAMGGAVISALNQ